MMKKLTTILALLLAASFAAAQTYDANGRQKVNVETGTAIVTQGTGSNLHTVVDSGTVTVSDGSGALNVIVDSSALPSGASTLGEQQTQTTALQVIDNLPNTQGSTTSGQSGVLVLGAVTTNAPTYTTAQTSPLSLTTTGSLRADLVASSAPGAAPPSQAMYTAGLGSGATGGLLTGLTVCDLSVPVNVTTATTTLLITGASGQHWRICAINLVTQAANGVALITGTGATCGTSTAAVNGGTTGATGWQFAANGGLTEGSGLGEIMSSKVTGGATGDSLCIVTSAATQLSGNISYALY